MRLLEIDRFRHDECLVRRRASVQNDHIELFVGMFPELSSPHAENRRWAENQRSLAAYGGDLAKVGYCHVALSTSHNTIKKAIPGPV